MSMSSNEDVLCFFAFSADNVPGAGVGEHVATPDRYAALGTIRHWRRMFSSLWSCDSFMWRGHTYRSHSHAYQAAKFAAAGCDAVAFQFCVESKSELGYSGSGLDAHHARKMVRLTEQQLAQWAEVEDRCKEEIYYAKYGDTSSRTHHALLATGNAQLWNRGPRIKTMRNVRLERLRSQLLSE